MEMKREGAARSFLAESRRGRRTWSPLRPTRGEVALVLAGLFLALWLLSILLWWMRCGTLQAGLLSAIMPPYYATHAFFTRGSWSSLAIVCACVSLLLPLLAALALMTRRVFAFRLSCVAVLVYWLLSLGVMAAAV